MDVKLKIKKKPLTPETHTNQYELVSNYMHGDADGDTTKTFFFNNDEEGIKRLKLFLAAYDALDDGEYMDEQATDFFKSIGIEEEEAEELGSEFGDEFYEGDMTCDGNAASLQGLELYFWNESGVKFEVDFTVKK